MNKKELKAIKILTKEMENKLKAILLILNITKGNEKLIKQLIEPILINILIETLKMAEIGEVKETINDAIIKLKKE